MVLKNDDLPLLDWLAGDWFEVSKKYSIKFNPQFICLSLLICWQLQTVFMRNKDGAKIIKLSRNR